MLQEIESVAQAAVVKLKLDCDTGIQRARRLQSCPASAAADIEQRSYVVPFDVVEYLTLDVFQPPSQPSEGR